MQNFDFHPTKFRSLKDITFKVLTKLLIQQNLNWENVLCHNRIVLSKKKIYSFRENSYTLSAKR